MLMFIQQSKRLLENLFVAVSFDIVAGRHKWINVSETLLHGGMLARVTSDGLESEPLKTLLVSNKGVHWLPSS